MFFEKYAHDHGFDPLLPSAWYAQSSSSFTDIKVLYVSTSRPLFVLVFEKLAQSHLPNSTPLFITNRFAQGALVVLSYHKDSFSRALMDLFPDIGIDPKKFLNLKSFTHS